MKKKFFPSFIFVFFITVSLVLSLCACTKPKQEDTGGDTDIGGLFWDILHGERGDGNIEKDTAK